MNEFIHAIVASIVFNAAIYRMQMVKQIYRSKKKNNNFA